MDNIKLKYNDYNILLIGTGATGSNLLPPLCQLLNNYTGITKHKLFIMDGDFFEEKNIKNQKCTLENVGFNKAEVLCERYQAVYPKIDISYIPEYLKSKDQLKNSGIFNKPIILIGCVDNEPSRIVLNDIFNDDDIKNIIYIDSGNGTINRTGQIVVGYKNYTNSEGELISYGIIKNKDIVPSIILQPVCSVFPQILNNKDEIDKHVGCGAIVDKYPQNIGTNLMASSIIFRIMNNIISDKVINTHIVFFDATTGEVVNR